MRNPRYPGRFKNLSKKSNLIISISILLAGILIGGYLVLSSKIGSADLSQQIMGFFGAGNQQQDEKTKDVDQDGLTDWQEEIYKTDPLNPDTDGDGYLDGEEVLSGYDPLKPAPDDKLLDKAIEPRPKAGSLQINLTDALAEALLAEMQKTKAEETFTVEDEDTVVLKNNELIDNALIAALSKSPQLYYIPTIPDSEIQTSNDNSETAIKSYAAKVMAVLDKHISAEQGITKSGLEVALESTQTKDYSALDKYIRAYKNSYQEIKTIPAPSTWKEIHRKYLSLILGSANIFEAIKQSENDPLRAMIAIQQYEEVIKGLKQILEEAAKLMGVELPQ